MTTTESEGCMVFLRQQGQVVRSEAARRGALAARLGITVERLNRLLAASALRPDVRWT